MPNKILLIEDDSTMLSLLHTLLTMEGFQVLSTGDESIDNLITTIIYEQPDVILLDVNLRRGSGIDLLSAIRADPSLNNVRVIMSSGMDFKNECIQKGAQGFIMKPYMPDDLIKIIGPSQN